MNISKLVAITGLTIFGALQISHAADNNVGVRDF